MINKALHRFDSIWRLLGKGLGLAALTLTAMVCACNKIETFKDSFVAFDTAKSSVVSINAEGEFTGSYTVHYTGPKPTEPIVVSFEVTCGGGLAEGTDYKVATAGVRSHSCRACMTRLSKSTGCLMTSMRRRITR